MSATDDLTAEVARMMREKIDIQCVVMSAKDWQEMTGLDPQFAADFGSFLGIPIRLGDRTHVRATLAFRLKAQQREGAGDV